MWVRVVVSLLAVVSLVSCGDDGDGESSAAPTAEADDVAQAFVIPAGTGDAIDAGEPVDILPERIALDVGDVIEIVNDDERNHLVGPFFVRAGETFRHRFSSPGEFEGECSVHPSGRVVVVVT